jgi:hypothetical protein
VRSCPKCKKKYDDDWGVCLYDNSKLMDNDTFKKHMKKKPLKKKKPPTKKKSLDEVTKADQEFITDQMDKALNKWKWKVPWFSFVLAFIHPLGMLYNSLLGTIVYLIVWFFMFAYWPNRPLGVGFVLSLIFSIYAYFNIKWKNAGIEKWRYGLSGLGNQNPRKMGCALKGPDENRRFFPFF